jgi:triosephosphate isomerase
MRKPFIAGNWKMNTDMAAATSLARGLVTELGDVDGVDTAVCPPFVYLEPVSKALSSSHIALGAQDIYFEENGAFTGEISCAMLKDVSCSYVIVGHSERRHVIGETDEIINKKLHAAITGGLLPILCVGETLDQRQASQTQQVVTDQIKKGFEGLSQGKAEAVTVAYEPVWAIGTGKTATSDQAQEVHAMIRSLLEDMYDSATADHIRIQYGGSAKPANTKELMACEDVDGLLVGGASLKVEDFSAMIQMVA